MEFYAYIQQLSLGEMIELVEIDLTDIGGDIIRITPREAAEVVDGTIELSPLTWRGETYSQRFFQTSGWEWSGKGKPPTPKLIVGNLDLEYFGLSISYGQMLGAKVTRWRTFRPFLDGEEFADVDGALGPEVFYINRKAAHTWLSIEFELATPMEMANVQLPRRMVTKNACPWRYRVPDGEGDFDYTNAICPYDGAAMFTFNGAPTMDVNEDRCGHRVPDCILRFGDAPLPFGGFPGAGIVRV